jgi:hypothetical protein
MAKLSSLFGRNVTFLMSNQEPVLAAPASPEFLGNLSFFQIVNLRRNLMAEIHRPQWLNFGLLASIVVFVSLAGAAFWQISQVSVATARMEEMTELLALADNWLGDVRQADAARRSGGVLQAAPQHRG